MAGLLPRKVEQAVTDLLELHGPIDKPIALITRYRRRRSFHVDIDSGHLLTVLAAVGADDRTPAEARAWARAIESVYRQRVYRVADWPASEDTDQTRTRLVLRNLSGSVPGWLGLDPYGLDAMQRVLSLRAWADSVRVLRETLTDPANPLTYAYAHDDTDLAVFPAGPGRGFILAMNPPEHASAWTLPQMLATGIVTKDGDLKLEGLVEFGGATCSPDLIRSALEPHQQAIVDHLAARP